MSSRKNNTLRAKLWCSQFGHCAICGKKIRSLLHVTIDHVVPRSLGGSNEWNRVAAHKRCNEGKSDRAPNGCELLWLDVVNTRLLAWPKHGYGGCATPFTVIA
jgi:5-methylcytosine-specific restriction endonuclease McrA